MGHLKDRRAWWRMLLALVVGTGLSLGVRAETPAPPLTAPSGTATPAQDKKPASPDAKPAPSTPETKSPPSATPPAPTPSATTPSATTPGAKPPANPSATKAPDADDLDAGKPLAPEGKPGNTEIEPNAAPGVPENATTENVDVPSRTAVMINGKSSYDEAFKSIKASLASVKAGMDKTGLKPTGHPITIFSEPDDKGFKYQAGVPIGSKPDGKPDLPSDITIGQSPSGKAIKFQHRGAYEDIDSTYDVITAYLDAKGLQVDSPYIEEYLTDLTTADDPNLQVDIYVFIK